MDIPVLKWIVSIGFVCIDAHTNEDEQKKIEEENSGS